MFKSIFLIASTLAVFTLDYPQGGYEVPPVNYDLVKVYSNINMAAPLRPITRQCRDATSWALTFDDGVSQSTIKLLAELKKRNIKATFFVVGSQVLEHPEILKMVYDDKHEIAQHTWSHPHLTTLSNEEIITELMYTQQIIYDVIGVNVRFFRAPYGEVDQRVNSIIQGMGYEIIHWNRDTHDAVTSGTTTISSFEQWAISGLAGTISLQHDLTDQTVDVAPIAIDILARTRYNFKLVSECTGLQPYRDEQVKTGNKTIPITAIPTPTPNPTSKPSASLSQVPNIMLNLLFVILAILA